MTLTIELTPEEAARLKSAAHSQGIATNEYARRLLTQHLSPAPPSVDAENAALIALLQSWREEDATDDPTEIATRQQEWEEMQANLEANRLSLPVPEVG